MKVKNFLLIATSLSLFGLLIIVPLLGYLFYTDFQKQRAEDARIAQERYEEQQKKFEENKKEMASLNDSLKSLKDDKKNLADRLKKLEDQPAQSDDFNFMTDKDVFNEMLLGDNSFQLLTNNQRNLVAQFENHEKSDKKKKSSCKWKKRKKSKDKKGLFARLDNIEQKLDNMDSRLKKVEKYVVTMRDKDNKSTFVLNKGGFQTDCNLSGYQNDREIRLSIARMNI